MCNNYASETFSTRSIYIYSTEGHRECGDGCFAPDRLQWVGNGLTLFTTDDYNSKVLSETPAPTRTPTHARGRREDAHEHAEGKLPPRKGGAVRPHPHRGGGHEDPTQPAHAAQRQRRGEAESPTKRGTSPVQDQGTFEWVACVFV